MTELTDDAVKALLDGTTEGPWTVATGNVPVADTGDYDGYCRLMAGGRIIFEQWGDDEQSEKDAHLAGAAPAIARALLDARAENARLRADAQAAVALVVEQAAAKVSEIMADSINVPISHDELADTLDGNICALAPADGLAAVEALRKELDATQTQLGDWIVRADEANVRAEKAEAELAAAEQREARRTFPILKGDGAKIDYQLVADHAKQARSNHGQSVDRLAARGGLSWCELYAVLHNRKWEKLDTNEAMVACRSLEARYLAALSHNGRGE